ncbi:MAG: hypothetical protein ACO3EL_08050 [Burkholderiaceae bacterium]
MHKPCVISIVLGLLMLSTAMHVDAQSSQCSAIRDDDLRAYCRAITGGGQGQCSSIRESDLRAMCRAELGGGSTQCSSISDADRRAFCRARTS